MFSLEFSSAPNSVADPGCLSRILFLIFLCRIPDPWSKWHRIPDPDPQQRTACLAHICYRGTGTTYRYSWKYDPGCLLRIPDLEFFHPRSRSQKSTGSRIRIYDTGDNAKHKGIVSASIYKDHTLPIFATFLILLAAWF